MNDVFRANEKKHDHTANGSDEFDAALHGEEGKINYRDFGHWADMANEHRAPRNSSRAFCTSRWSI